MMLLATYALPKLGPMSKGRKIREASRSVNVFLSRARSRAIETGRPCGVVFQRVSADTSDPLSNAVSMLYQAEVPPPYAGDTMNSQIILYVPPDPEPGEVVRGHVLNTFNSRLIRIGDIIQLNGQGPWYEIIGPDINDDGILDGIIIRLTVDIKYRRSLPWSTNWSAPVSFKILRQPVRTIAQPLTLPVGTTVDLGCSGTDSKPRLFDTGKGDVTIMFSPNGSVGRIYWDSHDFNKVTMIFEFDPHNADAIEPIYLLIGWRDLIENVSKLEDPSGNIDEENISNWQNLSNLWIALSSQSGLVTTAELASPDKAYDDIAKNGFSAILLDQAIEETRQYARQAQSKGGR